MGVAGLEEEDAAVAVGDEAGGGDAAGGAAADDDVVVFLGHGSGPPPGWDTRLKRLGKARMASVWQAYGMHMASGFVGYSGRRHPPRGGGCREGGQKSKSPMLSLVKMNGAPSRISEPLITARSPSLPAFTEVAPGSSVPSAAARST